MHVLRIEHDVASYEAWKDAFDSDPLGREAGGALGHRVFRASSDPNHVLIDQTSPKWVTPMRSSRGCVTSGGEST